MIILIVILFLTDVVLGFFVWNLLRKLEAVEDNLDELEKEYTQADALLDSMQERIQNSMSRMKSIDRIGSFEADDETGYVFREMYSIIEELDGYYGQKAKSPKSKRYFTNITEIAINAYNNLDDIDKKNRIYNRFIQYPFDKLAENVIHTYKTYYFDDSYEDVKASVVAFLNEKMHKFKGDKGKAFSYFTVIARNFLFNENNANYAKMKGKEDLDAVDIGRNVPNEVAEYEAIEEKSDFMDFYVNYIDLNLSKLFIKERDRRIADSVNELFRNRKDLYSYNKKALYILIRDRTGVNTQYITKVIGKMKVIFVELNTEYTKKGILKLNHNIERYYDEG